MSSDHLIIVARNDTTGKIELPLGDLTLYGLGDEDRLLVNVCARYGPDWTLSLYRPCGDRWTGTHAPPKRPELSTVPGLSWSGTDLARGPDQTVVYAGGVDGPSISPIWPFEPTPNLRWNAAGSLEQLWISKRPDGRDEEWRPVPKEVAPA